MAIPIINQRISHPAPLPNKLGKHLGSSLLDIAIVGGLILIVPPLALLVFLMTPVLSLLVKQSAKRELDAQTASDPKEASNEAFG